MESLKPYNEDMVTRSKQGPPTNSPTQSEVCYLAGLIDADGCIAIAKMKPGLQRTKSPRYSLHVNVVNTSLILMEWLVEKFGGIYRQRRRMSEKHKDTYDWYFNDSKAIRILKLVEPHLIIKKMQAHVAIDLIEKWESVPAGKKTISPEEVDRRESLYQHMKMLNQFGPVQPQRLSFPAPQALEGDAIV